MSKKQQPPDDKKNWPLIVALLIVGVSLLTFSSWLYHERFGRKAPDNFSQVLAAPIVASAIPSLLHDVL